MSGPRGHCTRAVQYRSLTFPPCPDFFYRTPPAPHRPDTRRKPALAAHLHRALRPAPQGQETYKSCEACTRDGHAWDAEARLCRYGEPQPCPAGDAALAHDHPEVLARAQAEQEAQYVRGGHYKSCYDCVQDGHYWDMARRSCEYGAPTGCPEGNLAFAVDHPAFTAHDPSEL